MSQGLAYVITYNVGDNRKSLTFSNGISIRSGGSAVMTQLPCPQSVLDKIPGVLVGQVPFEHAKNIVPDHPKKAYYEAMKKQKVKR